MRVALLLCLALLLAACGGDGARPTPAPTPTPAERVLNIYNWDTYIDPEVLTQFEQRFNVRVNYSNYANNDELLAAIEAGGAAYDVIVPSDYMVTIMRQKGLLAPLDKARMPNLANIDPAFLTQAFDPGNRYCAPYQWGTLGIGYNIKATGGEISSWREFFDPKYAGRIAMLDDPRTMLGAILINLGYSPNSTNRQEIARAQAFMQEHASQIAAFAADDGQDLLVSGAVDMVFEWSGDIFQVMEENPDIRYVIPSEGSYIWTDYMCVPAASQRRELAQDFINFVLDPAVGAAISNYVRYSSPNLAALRLLNQEDRANPALYPPQRVRDRLFFAVDIGPDASALYAQAWEEILAIHGR